MVQDLDNIKKVNLWPTTIIMTEYHNGLQELTDEIYKLSLVSRTIRKSNYGGWQSDVTLYENPVFKPLCQHISRLCFKIFGKDTTTVHQMWACINKKHNHNVIHNHGNYSISGVYYVTVPKNSGDIVFRDPRPAATATAARGLFDSGECEQFIPYTGLLLLFPSYLDHFVLPSNSDDDRIAISFDLTLKD